MDIAEEAIRDKYAVATDERTGLNIVFFDCGMGDGAYTTWFGGTRSGEVACFSGNARSDGHAFTHARPAPQGDPANPAACRLWLPERELTDLRRLAASSHMCESLASSRR